jgi:parvulin-like peptidyl-prolyl isomerase
VTSRFSFAYLAAPCIGLLLASGCSSTDNPSIQQRSLADPRVLTSSPPPQNTGPIVTPRIIATMGTVTITADMLQRPLIEAYGLPFMLHMLSLESAKQKAAQLTVTVTPDDIAAERQRTLEQTFGSMFADDKLDPNLSEEARVEYRRKEVERLMDQLLQRQRISRQEFALAMETGAYLRKIAEKELSGRIRDEDLMEAFRIKFGGKVKVRHIQLANRQEAAEALRRIGDGESFEKVAAAMSRDLGTRLKGGEIRPFSQAERMWPQSFKDAAFALKDPGEVSGLVDTGTSIHLIQLIDKIAPAAVKFEDHKEIVRQELLDAMAAFRMKQLREEVALAARQSLKIEDPILRRQYQENLDRAAGEAIKDPDVIRGDWRAARNLGPFPQQGGDNGAGEAASSKGSERPPATRPAN